jgi:hypothetical protein
MQKAILTIHTGIDGCPAALDHRGEDDGACVKRPPLIMTLPTV